MANINDRLNQRLLDIGAISIEEARSTHVFEIMDRITPIFGKRVDLWTLADGAVGLYRDADGQAYEVQVRPAKNAVHKDILPVNPTQTQAKRNALQTAAQVKSWQNVVRKPGN